MGLVPEGATYGSYDWSDELPPFELRHFAAGSKRQLTKLSVDHTAHVYFADYDKPYAYFVVDHMRVNASPGEILLRNEAARGFFNTSAFIAYRGLTVSDNCRVTRLLNAPLSVQDDFGFGFQGVDMVLNAATREGSGRRVFKPEYSTAQNRISGWSLVRAGAKDGWIAHQRDVWNALGIDGPDGGTTVRREWLDLLYKNGSPFGAVKDMPNASYQSVAFELFSMWKVEKSSSTDPFTSDRRSVSLTIDMDYSHRLNLFNNATLAPQYEALRGFLEWCPALPKTVLKLHEIAKAP